MSPSIHIPRNVHRSPGADVWSRQGMIMVEVALALVVLTIGILSVFALFNRASDRSRQARSETQNAIFADGVMQAVHAGVSQAEMSGRSWPSFWSHLADGTINLPVPAGGSAGVWANKGMAIRANVLVTNVYTNFSLRANHDTDIINHALRYFLGVQTNDHVSVSLRVWEGEFGSTNDIDALYVYTEFYPFDGP